MFSNNMVLEEIKVSYFFLFDKFYRTKFKINLNKTILYVQKNCYLN